MTLQTKRFLARSSFFALFLLAPVLDIFRFDLTLTQFIVFGQALSFDLTPDWIMAADAIDAGLRMITRFVIPVIVVVCVGFYIFWRWGRLYCGWLCPHFSVVETINGLMKKRTGKVTLWESAKPGERRGEVLDWLLIVFVSASIAFTWALGFLSYLMPPIPMYTELLHFELSRGEVIFLSVATTVFTLDFVLARHLFCKYGCAFGLVQSLFWMMNSKAMVVQFDRDRAAACKTCDKVCDEACPMRLPARGYKRSKFTCTQCGECVSACREVQKDNPQGSLLEWADGSALKQTTLIPMKNIDKDA